MIDQETPHKHGEVYFSTTSLLICLVRQAWLAWRTCFLLHAWLATRTRSITDLYIYKWGKDACSDAIKQQDRNKLKPNRSVAMQGGTMALHVGDDRLGLVDDMKKMMIKKM